MAKIYFAIFAAVLVGSGLLFYALNGLFKPIGKAVKNEAERLINEANEGDGK